MTCLATMHIPVLVQVLQKVCRKPKSSHAQQKNLQCTQDNSKWESSQQRHVLAHKTIRQRRNLLKYANTPPIHQAVTEHDMHGAHV